uniref:(California timema) hypothetical protein n=1 Tax=Timema californicum TaxID=61474 RepID=A0A7R9P3A5_TIMCA|nr:unnamed protein product [Timema californicum]
MQQNIVTRHRRARLGRHSVMITLRNTVSQHRNTSASHLPSVFWRRFKETSRAHVIPPTLCLGGIVQHQSVSTCNVPPPLYMCLPTPPYTASEPRPPL